MGTPKSSIYRWFFHYNPSILGTPMTMENMETPKQGARSGPAWHAPGSQPQKTTRWWLSSPKMVRKP